jgi:hypothetical protein
MTQQRLRGNLRSDARNVAERYRKDRFMRHAVILSTH